MRPPVGTWLLVAAGVVIAATLAAALASMGLPSEQRLLRLDERRIADLGALDGAIEAYVRTQRRLPPALSTLAAEPGSRLPLRDPGTAEPYAYAATGPRSYRLCAQFATDTARSGDRAPLVDPAWQHGQGRHCFERRIEAEGRRATVLP